MVGAMHSGKSKSQMSNIYFQQRKCKSKVLISVHTARLKNKGVFLDYELKTHQIGYTEWWHADECLVRRVWFVTKRPRRRKGNQRVKTDRYEKIYVLFSNYTSMPKIFCLNMQKTK